MVEVVNINKCRDWGKDGDIRIDRTTKWGNPWAMHGESERDFVCDKYEEWFKSSHLDISELRNAKRLGCHCSPKRCHGDFLKKLIENLDIQMTL